MLLPAVVDCLCFLSVDWALGVLNGFCGAEEPVHAMAIGKLLAFCTVHYLFFFLFTGTLLLLV